MTSFMHMVASRNIFTQLSHVIGRNRINPSMITPLRKNRTQSSSNRPRQFSKPTKIRDQRTSHVALTPEVKYKNEINTYERGKRRLALMMEKDPETFSDKDIEEALAYLLPSSLFAKDARPMMKHPLEFLPKVKAIQVDKDNRPLSAAFYTGFPAFYDVIHEIGEREELLMSLILGKAVDKLSDNVIQDANSTESNQENQKSNNVMFRWLTFSQMKELLQEDITERQYKYLIARLERLEQFPNSDQISGFIDKYRKAVEHRQTKVKIRPLNQAGVASSTGKRKSAVANIQIQEGTGNIQINDKSLIEHFPLMLHREQVLYPLLVLNVTNAYNITCNVHGGGPSGQSGAIRLGIARALLSFNEGFKEKLDEHGLLIRDPRIVERKKPGQKKARRKFAWVKR